MTTLELLIQARKIFIERGGAVCYYVDERNRVCALGAMKVVIEPQYPHSWSPPLELLSVYRNAEILLNRKSRKIFEDDIIDVNDQYGTIEVLKCYDAAIEEERMNG